MEIYWIGIMCVILCVHVKYSSGQNGLPTNPCPNMFQYQNSNGEWQGIAYVPNSPLGQTIKLQVMLSLRAELPSQYVGKIELFGSREAAVQEIRAGLPITYRVRFPLQSPLPKLTQIAVNGQVLCSGPPATGSYVTNILLEHSLYTEVAAGLSVSGFGNNIQSPYQYVTYDKDSDLYPSEQPYQPRPIAPVRPQYTTITPAPIYYTQPQSEPQPQLQVQYQLNSQPQQQPTQASDSEICGTAEGSSQVTPLIVDGSPVARGTWPWLVAVYTNIAGTLTFICGGNLVSHTVVVTAAHCLQHRKENEVLLYLGRYNIHNWLETGSKAVAVEKINVHYDYMSQNQDSFDADVAVVIMKESVQYTEYIRPICLWEDSTNTNEIVHRMGTVVGWGKDGSGNVTPEPKMIELPIVSGEECLRSNGAYTKITSQRTFCAGGRDGRGPCKGDSGSGMTLYRNNRWWLRGIVSVALLDNQLSCNLGEYVVFTDAAQFGNWIRSFMR